MHGATSKVCQFPRYEQCHRLSVDADAREDYDVFSHGLVAKVHQPTGCGMPLALRDALRVQEIEPHFAGGETGCRPG